MGQHLSALYAPLVTGPYTNFEFITYNLANFVHPDPQNPQYRRFLYTKGAWFNPSNGQSYEFPSSPPYGGLHVTSLYPSEAIIAVSDIFYPFIGINASFVLTTRNQVDAVLYGLNGGSQEYLPVQDPYGGAYPPKFLEMAALVDTNTRDAHALTLASDNHGGSSVIDWFGPLSNNMSNASWTVIPLFLAYIPGGRLITASYSISLQERDILVATADAIKLIRYTPNSTQLEDFASFPGEKIISLTSFSVSEDTAQRAVVATTSDDLNYQLWEISYESNIGQPLLIGTLSNISLLDEISGYANPNDHLRHIAMITKSQELYRASYNQNGGGFQYTPWPGVPLALP